MSEGYRISKTDEECEGNANAEVPEGEEHVKARVVVSLLSHSGV